MFSNFRPIFGAVLPVYFVIRPQLAANFVNESRRIIVCKVNTSKSFFHYRRFADLFDRSLGKNNASKVCKICNERVTERSVTPRASLCSCFSQFLPHLHLLWDIYWVSWLVRLFGVSFWVIFQVMKSKLIPVRSRFRRIMVYLFRHESFSCYCSAWFEVWCIL